MVLGLAVGSSLILPTKVIRSRMTRDSLSPSTMIGSPPNWTLPSSSLLRGFQSPWSFFSSFFTSSLSSAASGLTPRAKQKTSTIVRHMTNLPSSGRIGPAVVCLRTSFHSCQGCCDWLITCTGNQRTGCPIKRRDQFLECGRQVFWRLPDGFRNYLTRYIFILDSGLNGPVICVPGGLDRKHDGPLPGAVTPDRK